jgi:hypothetical protein
MNSIRDILVAAFATHYAVALFVAMPIFGITWTCYRAGVQARRR